MIHYIWMDIQQYIKSSVAQHRTKLLKLQIVLHSIDSSDDYVTDDHDLTYELSESNNLIR
ncbi:unnamed protein product [Brugia timori]|nr:unnamed protein product [Brugia timori]